MNKKLVEFARDEIRRGLAKCTEDEQQMFKRIFYDAMHGEYPTLEVIIDMLDEDRLSSVMDLVDRTLAKHDK